MGTEVIMSKINKHCSRTELIQKRFKLMIEMSKKLQEQTDISLLAKSDKYIRIGGEQFMSVSLHDKSPLAGIGNKTTKIETVLSYLNEKKANDLSEKDWKSKEERRLQAWIIKKALINQRCLLAPLNLKSHFDELLFCLDEVSLGDCNHERENSEDGRPKIVRCDILAMGLQGGVYYPVLIELKYKRELGRLIEQLDNFIYDIEEDSTVNKTFMELMRICSGIEDGATLSDNFKKIIVWPKCKHPQKSTAKKLDEKEILEIEYEYSEDNHKDIGKWIFSSRGC